MYREPAVKGRKPGLKSTIWNKRKTIIQQNEEIKIQKNEKKLRNLWDNLKHSFIWIIEVSEGEEQKQEIENLFE